MTRVTSVDGGQVITTGLVNMRRFEQRTNEVLVMAELLDRQVTVRDPEGDYTATVEDIAIERERTRDWGIAKVFVRRGPRSHLGRSGAGAVPRCSSPSRTSPAYTARAARRARQAAGDL